MQKSLVILKPNTLENGFVGEILEILEANGLSFERMELLSITKQRAQEFYAEHSERPFYDSVTNFMSSGPIIAMMVAGDDAINKIRVLAGPTDPLAADAGTIRRRYGDNIERNALHASDSLESAIREIDFFFS